MRVFVSSVIGGYEDCREAARAAIQLLGDIPVMAEYDFGAKPMTPREACLEGVRGSDAYIGLFGRRYGFVADQGKSVTEEEFEEAQRRGLPILIFEEEKGKEATQQEFLERVKAYEAGYFRDTYASPGELKEKAIKALANLKIAATANRMDAAAAKELLERRASSLSLGESREPQILVGICPSVEGHDFLATTELGNEENKGKLLRLAMMGGGAVLRPELGYREILEEKVLRWLQPLERTRGQAEGVLEIHSDGVIQAGRTLEAEGSGTSILRHFLIDETMVGAFINATLSFAHSMYGAFESGGRIASVFVQVRMVGAGNKMLGVAPIQEPSSVTLPAHSLEDPLKVPRIPHEVNRTELAERRNTADVLVELIRRQFVLAGAYYTDD